MTSNRMYKLLPFGFARISGKEVLVNELGDIVIAPSETVYNLCHHLPIEENLYKTLVANYFITEDIVPSTIDIYANRLRTKKGFLDASVGLHIFVLTLRCNQNCVYCQASSRDHASSNCSMSYDTLKSAIGLMFQSKSKDLTVEFQGGEPTLEYDLIKKAIEEIERINISDNRKITYVLCTNCFNLNSDILQLCKEYSIQISTSLDGPEYIHNNNRGKKDSYTKVTSGIQRAREAVGHTNVNALMTTSTLGVNYPIEIVDEYVKLGFNSIFLRALNPYGLASENDNWEAYTDKFIEFYKKALLYIIELNKNGIFFVEEFASIILRKILTPFTTGFVDLQSPAGLINSVLVYNYDGYVYASDESRMLAEYGDYTFRLGHVSDTFAQIVSGAKAKEIAKIWSNEVLAGCSDCALKVFCGADPVRNYSTQGDMYGHRPTSLLCKKNKAIIEFILSLIIEQGESVMPIFKNWLR